MTSDKKSTVFDDFAEDLLGERNIRPLIIIGASKVDNLLLEILDGYLLPKCAKEKDPDELLGMDRPIGTFSSRIRLSYRLGLIDKTLHTVLEKVRSLRNPCAHFVTFDHSKSPIREHLADLKRYVVSRPSFELTKQRYFDSELHNSEEELQCVLLTLCVLLEAIRESVTVTRGSKRALRIAAK